MTTDVTVPWVQDCKFSSLTTLECKRLSSHCALPHTLERLVVEHAFQPNAEAIASLQHCTNLRYLKANGHMRDGILTPTNCPALTTLIWENVGWDVGPICRVVSAYGDQLHAEICMRRFPTGHGKYHRLTVVSPHQLEDGMILPQWHTIEHLHITLQDHLPSLSLFTDVSHVHIKVRCAYGTVDRPLVIDCSGLPASVQSMRLVFEIQSFVLTCGEGGCWMHSMQDDCLVVMFQRKVKVDKLSFWKA